MKENNKSINIDVGYLLRNLWKKKIAILVIAILVTGGVFLYTYFVVTPKYKSVGKLYISNQKMQDDYITVQDVQLSNYLIKDYKEIILSENILSKVSNKLGNKISIDEIKKSVEITSPKDTRILEISFTNINPSFCAEVAKALVDATVNEVKTINKTSEASILEEPKVAQKPFSPNIVKSSVLAFVAAILLSCFIFTAKEILDDKIKIVDDVEEKLNATLLGVVPKE